MASRRCCIVVSLVQLASQLLRVQCKLPQRLLKVASSSQFREYALLLDSELLPNRGRSRTFPRIPSLLWGKVILQYAEQRRVDHNSGAANLGEIALHRWGWGR